MKNFIFQNTTKLLFGDSMIKKLSSQIEKDKKILLIFGGGSIKKNGVYQELMQALDGYNTIEFWGIESNPKVETIRKAVELGKAEKVDFLLAVGGGSVVDASKLISVAIKDDRDAWEIVQRGVDFTLPYIPLGAVLTLPATGSEMNRGSVISNATTGEKFSVYSYYPVFSILDPKYTYSLPKYQLSVGLADSFIHVIEQYLTSINQSPLMDRWAEGILLTLIEEAPKVLSEEMDYDARANFMLSATMALNGFISMGVSQDWATHLIGHEITALTGLTHGHTLVIVLPALLKVLRNGSKKEKILQYAERVWGIKEDSDEKTIDSAIKRTEEFFHSLGLSTTLGENNISDEVVEEIVNRFKTRASKLGENMDIDYKVIAEILEKAR